jgi:hypothetical protein
LAGAVVVWASVVPANATNTAATSVFSFMALLLSVGLLSALTRELCIGGQPGRA